ncbi:MAG: hypothetical protein J6126_00330 [Clostridia bacterium]|nr:hypothetical protein [Clostridia bacterium]
MIEFKGDISEKVQLDRYNRSNNSIKVAATIFFVSCLAITIIAYVIFGISQNDFRELLREIIIGVVVWVVLYIIEALTPKEVFLRFRISPHVIITREELSLELFSIDKPKWKTNNMSKVKKVLDSGEMYYIVFKTGGIEGAWICQKSNLLQGTIEEFEEIFKGKIKREKA